MANTEIDSLSLDITINGLNDKDVKNLESLANSIAKLQRNLKKLELNKLQEINIPQNLKGLEGVQITPIQSSDIENQISQFQEQFSQTFDFSEEYGELFRDVENSSQQTLSAFEQLDDKAKKLEGTVGKVNTNMKALRGSTKQVNVETGKTDKNIKKPKKQLSEIEKQLRRIKTIGLVKLIRGAIQGFIKGMQEGTKNLAQFDSSFNATMSTIATAKTQIFNSLALISEPLITTIAPIVNEISMAIQEVGNAVSMISASMKGMTSYTRINAKYMEDYANASKSASKFSFDTFETLNDTSKSGMYETVDIEESELSSYQDLFSIISDVKKSFEDIKEIISKIGSLIKGFIGDNISNITEIFSQSKEFTDTIKEVFTKINFEKSLKNITSNLTKIIEFVGIILDSVGDILEGLTPLIDVITSELSPTLLDMFVTSISPIFMSLKLISPILTSLIKIISTVLSPVITVISIALKKINGFVGFIFEKVYSVMGFLTNGIAKGLEFVYQKLKVIFDSGLYQLLNTDWGKMWSEFGTQMKKALGSVGDELKKVWFDIVRWLAKALDFVINAAIKAINLIIANDVIKTIVKWAGGDWKGIEWRSNLTGEVPSYANGGIVGELWQMNEYGNPEMLYNSNNGNTAVITQDQLAMAFQEAIFNTGLLDAISESKGIYIDGKYVAQSKNFKQELNRTNPGLNIK